MEALAGVGESWQSPTGSQCHTAGHTACLPWISTAHLHTSVPAQQGTPHMPEELPSALAPLGTPGHGTPALRGPQPPRLPGRAAAGRGAKPKCEATLLGTGHLACCPAGSLGQSEQGPTLQLSESSDVMGVPGTLQ